MGSFPTGAFDAPYLAPAPPECQVNPPGIIDPLLAGSRMRDSLAHIRSIHRCNSEAQSHGKATMQSHSAASSAANHHRNDAVHLDAEAAAPGRNDASQNSTILRRRSRSFGGAPHRSLHRPYKAPLSASTLYAIPSTQEGEIGPQIASRRFVGARQPLARFFYHIGATDARSLFREARPNSTSSRSSSVPC